MHRFLSERAAEPARLVATVRSGLEEAEAIIPPVNDQLSELAKLGVAHYQVEGPSVYARPAGLSNDTDDAIVVFKAVLLMPGGIGAATWSGDDFNEYRNCSYGEQTDLRERFVPYAKLPPPANRQAADVDSEVESALVLFDEIERLAETPMANEAINAMLERIGLRIGLYFEEGRKGTRPVRKVARGIIALGDFPLPVPPYGEPRVLPTAALDAVLQRRLAAELEAAAAGQQGAAAPAIDSGACCRDGHGHAHHVSEVATRRRDDVPVDAADRPAHGDGREIRPTGTVSEGIVSSRAQLELAATRDVRSLMRQHLRKTPEKSAGLCPYPFPFQIWFDGDAVRARSASRRKRGGS